MISLHFPELCIKIIYSIKKQLSGCLRLGGGWWEERRNGRRKGDYKDIPNKLLGLREIF